MTLVRRYVELAAFRAFVWVAVALTGLFSLLEFVEQLAYVGQGRYSVTDALIYVLLTAPSRLLQVTPVSMLLGSLLTLGTLARNSELTAMLSLGVSETRIVGSVLRLIFPIITALFLTAEFVIPPAQRLAQEQRTVALSSSTSFHADGGFWAQSDHQYLNVQRLRGGQVPLGIDLYSFEADGSLRSIVHAEQADVRPDGLWLLRSVSRRRVEASQLKTDRLASLNWRCFVPIQQIRVLMLPLESIPPSALYRYVRILQRQHQKATRYEQELWAKISIPFSMIAMIMIVAPFVFGSTRTQNAGQYLAGGASFGIVFSLGQQILGHLGVLLDLSPAITALAPSILVMALAVYLFRSAHRQRSSAGSVT